MAKGELDDQLSFWKQQLAGAPSILELPTDRPRPSVQDLRAGVHIRILSRDLLDRLHKLSQQQGVTLFMTLLAVYEVLLYRYSGQKDLVIGSPVAGRNHPSVEGLIGCFINMVVFRNQVAGDLSFRDLLEQVRAVALAGQDNQDVPFERLVEELAHGRDMSRAPIFQVVFALENLLATPAFPKLNVDLREEETRTAFHDLSLFVAERTDGLRVRFEYRTDLFDATTIARMAEHFQNLLRVRALSQLLHHAQILRLRQARRATHPHRQCGGQELDQKAQHQRRPASLCRSFFAGLLDELDPAALHELRDAIEDLAAVHRRAGSPRLGRGARRPDRVPEVLARCADGVAECVAPL